MAHTPEIRRGVNLREVRWKNDLGRAWTVFELCGQDGQTWRASMAELAQAAPFSSFAGYDRCMCMLAGEVELHVAGLGTVRLDGTTPPFLFDGAAQASGRPTCGHARNLNLMARRDAVAQVVKRLCGRRRIGFEGGIGTFVFCVEGGVSMEIDRVLGRLSAHDAIFVPTCAYGGATLVAEAGADIIVASLSEP